MIAAIVVGFAFTAPPAVAPDSATVHLTWTAPYDNSGFLAAYDFEIDGNVFRSALAPHAPGSAEAASFTVYDSTDFRVRAWDGSGNAAPWSNLVKAGPGGAASYRAVWHSAQGGAGQVSAWGGPNGYVDGLRVPRPEGAPDTVWVVFSEASRQDGYLTVERMNGTAAGAPRYVGHLSVKYRLGSEPDTLCAWWNPNTRQVRWIKERTFYDRPHNIDDYYTTGPTLLPFGWEQATVATQSQIQWELRDVLCRIYGYWYSGGVIQPCP